MNQQNEMIEDALIDAALAVMDQAPSPMTTRPALQPGRESAGAAADEGTAEAMAEGGPVWTRTPLPPASPTLDALDASRRPRANTVCEGCPNSVWFASPAELKCYCRVMFLVTWSSSEPHQITHCDGAFLGQAD